MLPLPNRTLPCNPLRNKTRAEVLIRCGNRRAAMCPSCSEPATQPQVFATLTQNFGVVDFQLRGLRQCTPFRFQASTGDY
jgi:hypothetical protein